MLERLFYGAMCHVDTARTRTHRAWRHVGGGGRFLAMFGFIYAAIGYSYTGERPTHELRVALRVPIELLPLWFWGLLWMAGGAVTAGLGASRRFRAAGFVVAAVVPAAWATFYLFAWLNGDTTRGPISFLVYSVFTLAVGTVAGMIDRNDIDPALQPPSTSSSCP